MKNIFFVAMFIYLTCLIFLQAENITIKFDNLNYQLNLNENIIFDLNKTSNEFENILKKNGIKYKKKNMGTHKILLVNKYFMEIQIDSVTNKIIAIIIYFKDYENNNKKVFDEVLTNDLNVKYNTSLNELKNILGSKNIEYSIREGYKFFVDIKLNYFGDVDYNKTDQNFPESIAIILRRNQ